LKDKRKRNSVFPPCTKDDQRLPFGKTRKVKTSVKRSYVVSRNTKKINLF
jgi:hypothetical protein